MIEAERRHARRRGARKARLMGCERLASDDLLVDLGDDETGRQGFYLYLASNVLAEAVGSRADAQLLAEVGLDLADSGAWEASARAFDDDVAAFLALVEA